MGQAGTGVGEAGEREGGLRPLSVTAHALLPCPHRGFSCEISSAASVLMGCHPVRLAFPIPRSTDPLFMEKLRVRVARWLFGVGRCE